MIKKKSKRGGGKSVSKKTIGYSDTPNFLSNSHNDLTLLLMYVKVIESTLRAELDFIESLIEENK